jgi:hypothetical protein
VPVRIALHLFQRLLGTAEPGALRMPAYSIGSIT